MSEQHKLEPLPPDTEERKPYVPPAVKKLGRVEDLTQGYTDPVPDVATLGSA